jgi:ankyrin repeat protein
MTIFGNISKAFKEALSKPAQRRKDYELYLGAICNSSWPVAKEIIQKYPDAVSWCDKKDGMTALHWAATYRSAKMIEYLVDRGANIEAADAHGFRALHHAAQCAAHNPAEDPTEALHALLDRGAQIDPRNNNGTTPLLHAMIRNKPWNVKALIIAGADETAANDTGNTPLKEAQQARGAAPDLYAAIQDGHRERARRAEEARLAAEDAHQQNLVREAVDAISNGTACDLKIMKPVRLAK